ncbi:hypothetical protein [Staphylococcus aureus]|uniref:hypothetical protein n=1 Tax=Staphylococcus aureus TaxID=1280 RepID=UPI0020BDA7AF|nr:hypothetical protein [Staphylococcus aureus]
MAYIKTTVTEGGFLTELAALLVANGWTQEGSFRKVGFDLTKFYSNTFNSGSIPADQVTFPLAVADHIIVKNANNELFGISRICNVTRKYGDVPASLKVASGFPDSSKLTTDETSRKALHTWMHNQYEENAVDTSELYFYMLNKVPVPPTGDKAMYPVNSVQAAIDVENLSYKPMTSGNGYIFEKASSDLLTMQSPMMKIKTRDIGTASNGWLTNWWSDSKIRLEGLISNKTCSIVIQADNTAAYDENKVPSLPIYMGQIVPLNPADDKASVLYGGMAVSDAEFDYTDPKFLVTAPLLPLEKQYPKNPGNGIDNLIVKRTKLGAYYQAYYFAHQAAPDKMPPDRVSTDSRQYGSAWKNERNEEYQYKYNPSGYTRKTHVSRAYVAHPEEGIRGYLADMIMTSSMGLLNGDRMKMKKEACPDAYDVFKYFLVDAVSPMTKRPGTAFSPAAFGIFEKEA